MTGIKPSSLSEDILEKYKQTAIKYWVRQIPFFVLPDLQDEKTPRYIFNIYDIENVLRELNENMLYCQALVLGSYSNIYNAHELFSLYGGIKELSKETNLITFYNELYQIYRVDIYKKNINVYDFWRQEKIDRSMFMNKEEIHFYYYMTTAYKCHTIYSEIDKKYYYKSKSPKGYIV